MGAPDTPYGGRSGAGAAYVFSTSPLRNFGLVDQVFGAAEMNHFGTAVAGGQVNDDVKGDLIVSAPDAAGNGGNNAAGAVYVKYKP